MIFQHLIDLAITCAKNGIKEAILSPGSRCAPISLAFIRHPDIHCRTIPDERSAGFIAMGMAQQLEKPVVLVCTSGSATLNYGPAIAEAYFQQVPLLVVTADRPPEWIDQWDGQTIRQDQMYGKHVKGSFQFPDDSLHPDKAWHAQRICHEAIALSKSGPMGPVHINIPIREPFYPGAEETFDFTPGKATLEVIPGVPSLKEETWIKIKNQLIPFRKILIVPGQQKPDPVIKSLLVGLVENNQAVVVTDTISNLTFRDSIIHHDFFLHGASRTEELEPDLIISFGKSIISKSLKLFLRKSKAAHWHLQAFGYVPDIYQRLSKIIQVKPEYFLQLLIKEGNTLVLQFKNSWHHNNNKIRKRLPELMKLTNFGEFRALEILLPTIPENSRIHLANSMAVRYVNFLGMPMEDQEIICNRGTSGIDGSNSTAVGCTFTTKDPVTLITGDMAFFYDRNAFWHQYNMPNLRIIVLNNHGGGIFRIIEGPAQLPEAKEYFETFQKLEANQLAAEMGFEYDQINTADALRNSLEKFYHPSLKPKILEIVSESETNARVLQSIRTSLKEYLDD
ncbi:MAG: 2-succinyl-5-enolpyruvyl-6-hydroxy-3-cyclohexene-1-carboxylic-acid synthase [Cyclobacteriaceae bacterium]